MADGKTLTWRKFPRDTIHNPALRYIAKRQPKEERHQVFTLFTALYCSADDEGLVDLSDLDVFADICMMDISELEDLLYQFLERNIIEEIVIDDKILYQLMIWIDPYPPKMSNAERQREYRERKKEKKSFLGFSGKCRERKAACKSEPFFNQSAYPAEQANTAVCNANDENFYENLANMSIEEINRFLLSDAVAGGGIVGDGGELPEAAPLTDISEPPEAAFSPNLENVTERYIENNACNAQNSRVTQRYTVTPKTEEKREDRKEEKRERQEETDRKEAEEREKEIRQTGEREIESEKKTEEEEREKRQTEESKRKIRKRERREKENTQIDSMAIQTNSEEEILEEEAEEKKRQIREPPPPRDKIRSCFCVLWNFFEKYNSMGFPDTEKEKMACMTLAIRMAKLENKKNSAEIIASQFANRFLRLLKTGGYYENMPFTPQMLLKQGNYSKVFSMVARILHPQDAGGEHWAAELQKAMQHNKDGV